MERMYDFTVKDCDLKYTPSDETVSLRNYTGDVYKQSSYRFIPVMKSLDDSKSRFEYPIKSCDLNIPLTDETECVNNSNENALNQTKYRALSEEIPVDGLKLHPTYRENASEEKVKSDNITKDGNFNAGLNAVLNRVQARGSLLRSRMESKHSINTIKRKTNHNKHFLQTNRQISVSEPLLVTAKDRGDNIALPDDYRGSRFSKVAYGHEKPSPSMNQEIKGCIYIKSSGKIFKSFIKAENISTETDDMISMPLGLRNKRPGRISVPFSNSNFKNKARKESIFGMNGWNFENDGTGDYEVAIFLSGINNISNQKANTENILTGYNKSESACKTDGKIKKKFNTKRKDSKSTLVQRKKMGTSRKVYPSSIKTLKINDQENEKTFSQKSHINRARFDTRPPNKTYKVSDVRFDVSSESDAEYIYQLPERGPKYMRPMKQKSVSKLSIVSNAVKQGEDVPQNPRLSSKFWEIDHSNFFARQMSQTSINAFANVYSIPKAKISDEKLQEKFENTFKRYATTVRHSGEVIPRKISTEWMMNAGVVNEILSEREADNAFKQAAGTKVTMNSVEYKEFIIMLTLRKKLPYYEIYRRMCGIPC